MCMCLFFFLLDSQGQVLGGTTSRGMCGRVGPSRTSEREGKGECVKGGGGEEGECAKGRAPGVLLHYT